MKCCLLFLTVLLSAKLCFSQLRKSENLVLITIDGFRWKEVFGGADSSLLFTGSYKKSYINNISRKYWSADALERRKKLMPFLWNTVSQHGRIYGNREYGNNVSVKNPYNVSYPGYSEIFTGYVDTTIKTNDLVVNPNENILEFINKQPGYKGRVASFASWDRAPYYLNANRSGFFVNGGYEPVTGSSLSPLQQTLNNLQSKYPKVDQSRPDYITYLQAKEYLRINKPKVMSIGFAWTDNAGHDGTYPLYLENMFAIDAMIADLWQYLQSVPQYRNNTTVLIMVDHGRGYNDDWTAHGPAIAHSNETWFAVIGPGISPLGEMKTRIDLYQYQFAQTMAGLLGLHFDPKKKTGDRIPELIK